MSLKKNKKALLAAGLVVASMWLRIYIWSTKMAFLLLLALWTEPTVQKFRVTGVERIIPAEKNDHFFGWPNKIWAENSNIWMLDNRSLVMRFDINTGKIHFFGGKGAGPGEINKPVTGFYMHNSQLFISNSSGTKLDVFSSEGVMISSIRDLKLPKPLYYHKDTLSFSVSGPDFLLKDGKKELKVERFDRELYGFNFDVATYKNFLFVSSRESKNSNIAYFILDHQRFQVIDQGVIEKQLMSEKKDLPKLPPGATYDYYYEPNYTVIYSHDELGFVMNEQSFTVYHSPRYGKKYVMHTFEPKMKKYKQIIVYVSEIGDLAYFYPLTEDLWLVYDGADNNLLTVNIEEIPENE